MSNPAPTINQINAFNATQGTIIDFNIIGGTELVRSNRIYIYDLSDNSLICTHLYVSTESIHELPSNTDSSIVYESGKSSADFVNGAQYYAQIQTFTDIAGTEGGSGLSVAKMFWCLVDPTLTITTIPSTISTTSYNVSATYNANTSVVSNIIQQYQFSLYSATGSLLQSSGVVVGSGTQQGTSTTYDISYNFSGLSVGSSYYVTVEVTTTQGMSVSAQSSTFTVSIDTPTLGEATVVNNACDGYISVTSNLSGEYGGSGSGEIVSFETDSENVFTKLQVDLDPIQDLHGYDKPWVGGAGANLLNSDYAIKFTLSKTITFPQTILNGTKVYIHSDEFSYTTPPSSGNKYPYYIFRGANNENRGQVWGLLDASVTLSGDAVAIELWSNGYDYGASSGVEVTISGLTISKTEQTTYSPYSNICPISGHDDVRVGVVGKNLFDGTLLNGYYDADNNGVFVSSANWRATNKMRCKPSTTYVMSGTSYAGGSYNGRSFFWDVNGNYLGARGTGANFTSYPNSAYMALYFGVSYVTDVIQIEEGTTATAYEPYTAETIHKDIEATYTPTVQENEPYQFKRTGDVGGDRESIELVGGSVAWNQHISILNTSRSATKNGVTFTDNRDGTYTFYTDSNGATANSSFIISQDASPTAILSGHKYYFAGFGSTNQNIYRLADQFNGVLQYRIGADSGVSVASANGRLDLRVIVVNGAVITTPITVEPILVDLTQLFGSTIADYIYTLEQGQAGAGVAFFRKYFPKPYYPYDAGTIKSVEGVSAHVTTGFNQWDEEWEVGGLNEANGNNWNTNTRIRSKNYIPIIPNTVYFNCMPTAGVAITACYYDANKSFISYSTPSAQATFTTPQNARFMRFSTYSQYGTTYKNDICINLSWDGERNGEYEPYVEHSYPLDDSLTLRGIPKIANGKLYYDGDTYESDGTVTRKYGIVDLGTLNWSVLSNSPYGNFTTTALNQLAKQDPTKPTYICNAYDEVAFNTASSTADKYIWLNNNKTLIVKDTSKASMTAAEFKTAMSGVYLVYELATPTTESAEPFESIQKVTPNYGTEEFVSSTIVPVGNNTQYYTRDIYGGYIDLVSGELVATYGCKLLDGSTTDALRFTEVSTTTTADGTKYVAYIPSTYGGIKASGLALSDSYYFRDVATESLHVGEFNARGSYVRFVIADQTLDTLAKWNAYLANNPMQLVYELAEPQTYQLTPQQIQTLVGQNNVWSEQGNVELSYHIPITNLLVKRQDVDDVSGSWLTLYSQPITQASDMDFTFIDFTNQYGKTYKYALVPLLTQTQSGVEVEVEGGYTVSDEVQSIFDGVFIADSTGSQKCKANVGYGNVDMNQVVGSITPIGAKYPIVITNSQNQYHNGSISGTIVPDDYYFNGNLSRIDMVNKRSELEQFLTNKRAKIIKDWNGNIWLVMIMDNVSCTFNNNYGMGIVNFNTNWVEVGDPTNQQDLQATGLINVGGV